MSREKTKALQHLQSFEKMKFSFRLAIETEVSKI